MAMAKRMVAPAREVPGKVGGQDLRDRHDDGHAPGDLGAAAALGHGPLDDQDENASPHRRPGDRPEVFRELEAELPRDQHAGDGENEGDGELPEVGSRLRLAQSEEQRLDAAGEHEENREDRAPPGSRC
jgi:hypothetical protein